MRGASVPEKSRDLEVMVARRNNATWTLLICAVGLVCALVIVVLDVIFSYDGLVPIFGSVGPGRYLSMTLAVITTPLQVGGMYLVDKKTGQKGDMEKYESYFWLSLLVIAFAVDISTNWMGLYETMYLVSGQVTELQYVILAAVGIFMSLSEYLVAGLLRVLSAFQTQHKEASKWLEEREGGGSGMGRPRMPRPSSNRPGGTRPPMGRPRQPSMARPTMAAPDIASVMGAPVAGAPHGIDPKFGR